MYRAWMVESPHMRCRGDALDCYRSTLEFGVDTPAASATGRRPAVSGVAPPGPEAT